MTRKHLIDEAIRLAGDGVSVIFTKRDKKPCGRWTQNQHHIAPPEELRRMASHPNAVAIATIGGAVSHGLEILDFDNKTKCVFNQWTQRVKRERPDLFNKLNISNSPSAGFHVRYRYHADPYDGNQKLATDTDGNVLIETRGEGGYALCPPSDGYQPIQNGGNIPIITPAERNYLISVCRTFDATSPQPDPPPQSPHSARLSPGDDFNQRTEWRAFIEGLGFTVTRLTTDRAFLTRPGKDSKDGHSAVFAIHDFTENGKTVGAGRLYNFSTNTPHLEAETSYDLFGLYTRFKHSGDFEAATKALAAQGYGEQRSRNRQPTDDQWGTIDAPGHAHYENQQDEPEGDDAKAQAKIEREVQRLTNLAKRLRAKETPKREIYEALCQDNRLSLEESILRDIIETVAPRLSATSAREIMEADYPEPTFFIDQILTEGLSIVVSPPKGGKSWLCLDWSVGLAFGGRVMGQVPVSQYNVLYCALEDNKRRIQGRLKTLQPDGAVPDGLAFLTLDELPTLNQNGIDLLEEYLDDHPAVKVVFVDTWSRVKPQSGKRQSFYDEDYQTLAPLQKIALGRGIAICLVYHTRKNEDPNNVLNEITGSTGIQGVMDGIAVLKAKKSHSVLHITGRDLEERDFALTFEGGHWTFHGDEKTFSLSEQQKAVIAVLQKADEYEETMTPKNLASILEWKYNNTKQILHTMRQNGMVISENGVYRLSDEWLRQKVDNPDNPNNPPSMDADIDSVSEDDSGYSQKKSQNNRDNPTPSANGSGYSGYSKGNPTDNRVKPNDSKDSSDSVIRVIPVIQKGSFSSEDNSDLEKQFLDSWWESWENTPVMPRHMVKFAQDLGIDLAAKCFASNGVTSPMDSVYQILVHLQSVAEAYGYRVERYPSPYDSQYGKWQLKQRELFDEVN